MEITWDGFVEWMVDHGTRIGIVLLIGIIAWFAAKKIVPRIIRRSVHQHRHGESRQGLENRAGTLVSVFMGLIKGFIVVLVMFMILDELSVPIGPVLAGFGIVGLAVGFGAQYLIRDLIAGIFILMENQYRNGDIVKINDIYGKVEALNLRKTVIRDLDGLVHHIPNGSITVASNATRHFGRVNLDISVAYGTDLNHAITVINRVARELTEDLEWKDKFITVPEVLRVNELGDSGIAIKLFGDVKPREQWGIMGQLRLRIKHAFDEEGIEIPWPHTKVYFGNTPGGE